MTEIGEAIEAEGGRGTGGSLGPLGRASSLEPLFQLAQHAERCELRVFEGTQHIRGVRYVLTGGAQPL